MFLEFYNYNDFEKIMKEKEVAFDVTKCGYEISTIKAPDRAINPYMWDYETAIIYNNGHIKIVNEYKTKEDALIGHKTYLNMSKSELDKQLGI